MKIVFTGGGTGGHFYPLIAIAEAIQEIAAKEHLVAPKLYYFGPDPYDEEALFENNIVYMHIDAGKVRRYFSLQNIVDIFHTVFGFMDAIFELFRIYPDVVISKGGYASVPVVFAAHLIGIPIIIHESDAKPGRANLFAAKYAYRIGIAFESAAAAFPKGTQGKLALVGIPVRREVAKIETEGARQELGLDNAPTLLVLGGSSGSRRINETVLAALPDLVSFANVIHQTGKNEFATVQATAGVALAGNEHAARYHAYPFLNAQSIRRAAGVATVIVSRAGAGSISELSLWQKPAILIPIPESVSHDQRTNAYTYARTGAAIVIEEENLSPHVLASEVRRIASDSATAAKMGAAGSAFMPGDAANMIAEEAVRISLLHENGGEV